MTAAGFGPSTLPVTRKAHPKKSPPKSVRLAAPEASPDSQTPPAAPSEKLTPEEQMERFAKELKNEDWGHQPC